MSAYTAAVLADAPQHYWRLSDPGGSLAFDIGSIPRHLVLNGTSPTSSPCLGPVSDGGSWVSQQSAYLWKKDGISVVTPLTIELIVWQADQLAAAQYVMEVASATFVCALFVDSTGHATAQSPTAGAAIHDTNVLATMHWHHLVATVSAAGLTTLYVDGASRGTVAGSAVGPIVVPVSVGGTSNAFGSPFDGAFAEAAVYNVALSATRVLAHFNAIDDILQLPVYRASGSLDTTTGVPSTTSDDLSLILSSVRRSYVAP